MIARLSSLLLLVLLLVASLSAKDKNKPAFPDYVLKASTVVVVVSPGAGEPLDEPMANSTARENVEKALMEWGRLRPVLDGQESDLVIAVLTGSGKMMRPTIKGGPIDHRPGVAQGTDSSIRIGGAQGRPPSASDPNSGPMDRSPHIGNEVGATEDSFVVYRGGVADPLDSPAVWRYIAKDCLRAPNVTAVEQFRKALADAEKLQAPKKP